MIIISIQEWILLICRLRIYNVIVSVVMQLFAIDYSYNINVPNRLPL